MMNKNLFIFLIGLILLALLSCQAAANLPNPFATATPTSTPTFTPSPTSSPTPTAAYTPTPLPTGTTKEQQTDGTTIFTDYDNQYELVFPAGWAVVGLSPDDLNQLMQLASKNNPDFQQTISLLKTMDPKVFRVFAFDFQPNDMVDGYTTNINIVGVNNNIIKAMTLQELTDETVQSIRQINNNIQVTSSKVTQTASNTPIGLIELNMPVNTYTGVKISVYEQAVIFQVPQGSIQVTLSTPVSMQSRILPIFNQIIGSLRTLGY